MIERAVRMNKLTSIEQVTAYTKAGGGCLTCFDPLEEILRARMRNWSPEGLLAEHEAYRLGDRRRKGDQGQGRSRPKKDRRPAQTSPLAPDFAFAAASAGMTNLQKIG